MTTTTRTTTIVLNGARGRMGLRIAACADADPSFLVAASLERGDTPMIVQQASVAPSLANVDVVVDFSTDEGTGEAIDLALKLPAALLVGTTALTPSTTAKLDDAARRIAVMTCSNTSLGVAVARHLAKEAARLLGSAFDVDIVETHHTKKIDAPSGTALSLAASVREGGGTIGKERIHSLRAGDVIGDHLVQFAGSGEILRIEHTATSRDLFALGALRAAKWLVGRPAGRYRIEDTFAV